MNVSRSNNFHNVRPYKDDINQKKKWTHFSIVNLITKDRPKCKKESLRVHQLTWILRLQNLIGTFLKKKNSNK